MRLIYTGSQWHSTWKRTYSRWLRRRSRDRRSGCSCVDKPPAGDAVGVAAPAAYQHCISVRLAASGSLAADPNSCPRVPQQCHPHSCLLGFRLGALLILSACEGPSGSDSPVRDWVAGLTLSLPLFCGSAHLRRELVRDPEPSAALGSNLLGVLAGGVMEYSSMAFGFRTIYLITLGPICVVISELCASRAGIGITWLIRQRLDLQTR